MSVATHKDQFLLNKIIAEQDIKEHAKNLNTSTLQVLEAIHYVLASFPYHFEILTYSHEKGIEIFLCAKIWEWPGNQANYAQYEK